MKKILVIGEKFHGKTTFSRFLKAELESAQTFSTSEYLVYRLGLIHGVDSQTVLADKEKYRPELIKLGNAMCDVDPGCLVSICLWSCHSEYAIIDGIRRVSEFTNVKEWFDDIYWINRPGTEGGLDNLELKPTHANHVIENDGSLEDLEMKAKDVAKTIKG